jgi:hypothetical protein
MHINQPDPKAQPVHIHGVFKRPHSSAFIFDKPEAYRQNAAACVSLSIQQCQRPDHLSGPAV